MRVGMRKSIHIFSFSSGNQKQVKEIWKDIPSTVTRAYLRRVAAKGAIFIGKFPNPLFLLGDVLSFSAIHLQTLRLNWFFHGIFHV